MTRGTPATRATNKRQYEARRKAGLCRGCGVPDRPTLPGKALCSVCSARKLGRYYDNKEAALAANQRYRKKLRDEVFAAYGGAKCACCGEHREEFLTIDHVNGDGAEHRREIGKATYKLYLWLRSNGFPSGFRILCMNCNFSIGMKGYCPHEKEKHMSLEKYGVDESVDQDELEKVANQGCPVEGCGKPVTKHGNVLACPVHGTEPFERKT